MDWAPADSSEVSGKGKLLFPIYYGYRRWPLLHSLLGLNREEYVIFADHLEQPNLDGPTDGRHLLSLPPEIWII